MSIFVGLDGGGTKTKATFLDADTQSYSHRDGAASRTTAVGWAASEEVVRTLILSGLNELGRSPADVAGMSLCMSGIDLPIQSLRMANALKPVFPNSAIEVVNDSMAILTAGTDGQTGIVLIGGSGSICMGEDTDGNIVRAGGYGTMIGDEGSGYEIGRQGLLAAIQCAEGRGARTLLWDRLRDLYKIRFPHELIGKVYDTTHPLAEIAHFAETVLELTDVDEVAGRLVEQAVASYVGLIQSVRARLNSEVSSVVVLSGGLFVNSCKLTERLRCSAVRFAFQVFQDAPSKGAVLRAIRYAEQQSSSATTWGVR